MMVPNHSFVPRKLFDTGLFDLKTEDGEGAFTDAVVATLNGIDPNWRHLKKSAAQTNIHRHGEDSALYLFPDGTAKAVDFVIGSGGSNPTPGWQVDEITVYAHADGADPDDHGLGVVAHPMPKVLPKGDAFARLTALNAFYQAPEGLNRPGGLVRPDAEGRSVADMEAIAQWFYQLVIEGVPLVDVFSQIRRSDEWRGKHPGQ